MKRIIVTGSSGLIGSEVVRFFNGEGCVVHGVDNNQRARFFGPQGDTRWSQQHLVERFPNFRHNELDIRDRQGILALVKELKLPPNRPTTWLLPFHSTILTPTPWER